MISPAMQAFIDEQKARIQALSAKWRTALWLNGWTITDSFYTDTLSKDSGASEIAECVAQTFVDAPYLEATIRWHVPSIADMDDERLEYIWLHEQMHILLKEMRLDGLMIEGSGLPHEERVATLLAHAFQTVAKEGGK